MNIFKGSKIETFGIDEMTESVCNLIPRNPVLGEDAQTPWEMAERCGFPGHQWQSVFAKPDGNPLTVNDIPVQEPMVLGYQKNAMKAFEYKISALESISSTQSSDRKRGKCQYTSKNGKTRSLVCKGVKRNAYGTPVVDFGFFDVRISHVSVDRNSRTISFENEIPEVEFLEEMTESIHAIRSDVSSVIQSKDEVKNNALGKEIGFIFERLKIPEYPKIGVHGNTLQDIVKNVGLGELPYADVFLHDGKDLAPGIFSADEEMNLSYTPKALLLLKELSESARTLALHNATKKYERKEKVFYKNRKGEVREAEFIKFVPFQIEAGKAYPPRAILRKGNAEFAVDASKVSLIYGKPVSQGDFGEVKYVPITTDDFSGQRQYLEQQPTTNTRAVDFYHSQHGRVTDLTLGLSIPGLSNLGFNHMLSEIDLSRPGSASKKSDTFSLKSNGGEYEVIANGQTQSVTLHFDDPQKPGSGKQVKVQVQVRENDQRLSVACTAQGLSQITIKKKTAVEME